MNDNNETIYPLIQQGDLPHHLAVIMDGNGRWAAKRHLPRVEGHKAGAGSVDNIIQSCIKLGIPVLSLYAFSTENWKRPETEIKALFELLNFYLKKKINSMVKNGISLRISGDISRLPVKSQDLLKNAIIKTEKLNKLILNICINYGSRDELILAMDKLIKKRIALGDIKKITAMPTWAELEENLYSHGLPDIDLLIRTAGEKRLSNFMLLQAAYAELYFTETHWPEFDETELFRAIMEFQKRERKFGGLVEKKIMENSNE